MSTVLTGALVRIFLNNKLYKEAQQVSWSIDYGEKEEYGIDSPLPQEIHSTRVAVGGQIQGLRLKYSGGLQAYNAKTLIKDILSAPYISVRIQDRSTGEDLLFVPNAKISRQSYATPAKGVVRLTFDFKGMIPFEPLDRV